MERVEVDGYVVSDEVAARALGKHGCDITFELKTKQVQYLVAQIEIARKDEKPINLKKRVIAILKINDVNGGPLAKKLLSETAFQEISNPFACIWADRDSLQEALEIIDQPAARKLQEMSHSHPAVVVVSDGAAEVYPA
jgi:hypothetical protein